MTWGGVDNRNEVHNECNERESSWNYPFPLQSVEQLCSMQPIPGAKNLETAALLFSFANTRNQVTVKSC